MNGPGTVHSIYSHMNNVVLVAEPAENLSPEEHEAAVRKAGLKMAHYLAKAGMEVEVDEVRTYTLNKVESKTAAADVCKSGIGTGSAPR